MIYIKSSAQIEGIRESGKILYDVLHEAGSQIRAGMNAAQLDKIVYNLILKRGATPAFLHYMGFPASACVSVNEEVIHGIPLKKRVFKEGDLVGLDIGVNYKGYISDSAYTFTVGKISESEKKLIEATKAALKAGIESAIIGNRISDVSAAIYAKVKQYGVVRDYCGHGVGLEVHEDPLVSNYPPNANSCRLKDGMVIAIEPMINLGTYEVRVLQDNWTVVTADHKKSAHFEHTVAITANGPRVLTAQS